MRRLATTLSLLAIASLLLGGGDGVEPFESIGEGIPGGFGLVPELVGEGTLLPGDPVTLTLSKAAKSSVAILVLGGRTDPVPFYGGTMIPAMQVVIPGFSTRKGLIFVEGAWPAGYPPGARIYAQFWIVDGHAPQGFSSTNGLQMTGN